MQVTVFLYGTLGKEIPGYKPAQGLEIQLPNGSTIGALLEHLGLSRDRLGLVAQNNKAAQDHHALIERARIRVFMPVTGG
jgi:sulfur carrier protein ThiS